MKLIYCQIDEINQKIAHQKKLDQEKYEKMLAARKAAKQKKLNSQNAISKINELNNINNQSYFKRFIKITKKVLSKNKNKNLIKISIAIGIFAVLLNLYFNQKSNISKNFPFFNSFKPIQNTATFKFNQIGISTGVLKNDLKDCFSDSMNYISNIFFMGNN
ncbi:uncharacterized protein ASCRUDRAFT_77185 [Ascoidea rubescens DSM 1968]|uniref:Uncharacterized protein n=1 Tax=Ascoidea rubescens DSM 1968 TaxID=1344418 RepID=A0A1D2VD54_9ASCO|nr:hypothetical protein ASCRUDRAFT_77185 [Ascoidea rubescens DSM 1968]ODV59450.1 hypothetical protein ASCRUDRAFT_77185 [Ascoidea rubescens DSM 1968]